MNIKCDTQWRSTYPRSSTKTLNIEASSSTKIEIWMITINRMETRKNNTHPIKWHMLSSQKLLFSSPNYKDLIFSFYCNYKKNSLYTLPRYALELFTLVRQARYWNHKNYHNIFCLVLATYSNI